MGQAKLPFNTWFLGPTRVHNPNGVSIVQAISAQLTAESRYILQRAAPFPLKVATSRGDLNPI